MKVPDLPPWRTRYLTVIGEMLAQYERCRCEMCRVAFAEAVEDYDEATG